MKLLVQSDDFGITRAVTCGIVYGIEHGIIRNTGMFTNMPWVNECVERIKPYLGQIALGIDLNISTGTPILPPDKIPTLVRADGTFLTSWESRKLDQTADNGNHAAYEDIYSEFDAQINLFIELTGKKPDYLHAHAYMTDRIVQIQRELSKKYDVIYSSDAWQYMTGYGIGEYRMSWYIKPSTLENQLTSSLKEYILKNGDTMLKRDYGLIVGHMGYVDRELMNLSTYNIYRLNDLDAVTSPEVLNWVKNNNVELITYKEIEELMH